MPEKYTITLIRRWWWRLRLVRCGCGQHRLARGTGMELAGVNHRADRPCFPCDDYGRPRGEI